MKGLVRSHRARTISAGQPVAAAPWLPLALVALLSMAGCARREDDGLKAPSPIESLAMRGNSRDPLVASQARGRKVYEHYCSICHGAEGKGDGFNATNLAVPPRDFSSPQFWRQTPDERLLLVVSKGGPAGGKSVLMQPWGRTLTDRQMRDVIAFLHTLAAQAKPKEHDTVPSTEAQ